MVLLFDYNVSLLNPQLEDSVACPYFMPVEKMENGRWPHPSRLPLGCGWKGHCTAPGHEGKTPSQDILESFCNLGYATSCNWAPSQRLWDSVRFLVSGPTLENVRENAEPATRVLYLTYVLERDHRPVEHGRLEFNVREAVWSAPHSDPRIQKMAECFLESFMKKRA